MGPLRNLVGVARDERARNTVKAGTQVFATVRNIAAIGAAIASIVTGGVLVTRDRAPEAPASAAPATAVPLLSQIKGKLAFEASFAQDLATLPPQPSGARAYAQVTARADGLDLVGPGAFTPLNFKRTVPARYLAELDLAFSSGSDGTFSITLRNSGPQQYTVAVDAVNELIRFQHVDQSVTPVKVTSLTPNVIPAAGIQKGRVVHLAAAVDGTHYRVFLDGDLGADVTDSRISVPDATTVSLSMGATISKGTLSVNGLRVYSLTDAATTVSPLAQLKGALVYEAAIPQDLGTPAPVPSGQVVPAKVQSRGDAIEIVPSGGPVAAFAPIILRRTIPVRFLAELELACATGSEGQFNWNLRSAGPLVIQVIVDVPNELLRLQLVDNTTSPQKATSLIASSVAVTGVQKGRTLRLAAALDGTRYRVFLDGEQIADVTEARIAVPSSGTTTLQMFAALTKGSLTLRNLKVYSLSG